MDLSLNKALAYVGIFLVLTFVLTLKIGGASNLPILVEQDGYCKIEYGETWKYSEKNFNCYETGKDTQPITFTQEHFREVCPKNKFLSLKFYSGCFHKGDSRS